MLTPIVQPETLRGLSPARNSSERSGHGQNHGPAFVVIAEVADLRLAGPLRR